MNHNRVEDTAPHYADSSDQASREREGWGDGEGVGGGGRRGQREGERLWGEEREKDGLEEENGIRRIQMEEWETDRHTDTHKNTETNKQKYM